MYRGYLVSKLMKFTPETKITGVDISSNGEVYICFDVSGFVRALVPSDDGTIFRNISTFDNLDFGRVLFGANTSEELLAIENFELLKDKNFRVIIYAVSEKEPPKFKFSFRIVEHGVEKTRVIESEEYDVRGEIQGITADCTENVNISVSGYKNGRWYPYVSLEKASSDYERVKFKAGMTVNEVGQVSKLTSVTLEAKPNDAVIPSNTVALYTNKPVKNGKLFVVGNNKGIINAFCSNTTPAQWRELERITANSFSGADGMLKITLTADSVETPEIEGYVIQE